MSNENTSALLQELDKLAGEWKTEGVHRLLPDTVVSGQMRFEWLEGGGFLIQRSTADHPDFPNGISIIGCDDASEGYTMHYFDSRGVKRIYEMSLSDGVWKFWRDGSDFSQRFTGTFSEDGNTITGLVEIATDGEHWERDMDVTYTKTEKST